jgi:hypothetical protein
MSKHAPARTHWSRYGFAWVTGALFVVSIAGHWAFAWQAFIDESRQHGQRPEVADFLITVLRDTLENWQSEFLQLMWQVAGLAWLYHVGSPQSKEGNDRLEEKVDLILHALDDDARKKIAALDSRYQRD